MSGRVRLVDIAERLHITKVSVSKALRNHPDISRETRELVKKAAAEMGYSPNMVARSLSSHRSNTVGVVVPKISHTFFASAIEAIQQEATHRGYGIVLAVSNENAALERQHIDRLLSMRVDGLLVSVSMQAPDLSAYERVRTMRVPLVFFDRRLENLGFSSVTIDDRQGAYDAVKHLVGLGYTRIGHFAGSSHVEIGRRRTEGYRAALEESGIPFNPDWLIEGGFDEAHGYAAFQRLHETGNIPDAILTVSFPVYLGLRAAMLKHAPRLVDRLRIVTFGEGGLNEISTYPHICVRQPARDLGQQALQLLLEAVERPDQFEPRDVQLRTDLISSEDTFVLNEEAGEWRAMPLDAAAHTPGAR